MRKMLFRQSKKSPKARIIPALIYLLLSTAQIFAAQNAGHSISGVVLDPTGAAVADAQVIFREKSGTVWQSRTDEDGRFSLETGMAAEGIIEVEAAGFALKKQKWVSGQSNETITIVLEVAALSEKIVVSPTRSETTIGQTAASVSVISSAEISTTAAPTIDDALRQIPGFQLFRRTGSRTANPTSQGLSLRGVGASGASRAAVFLDGVSLNDPFGGWVYWGRVPRESVENIEVLRGGASSLYGSGALGGVVNIFTHQAEKPSFSLSTSYGSQNTAEASVFAGGRIKNWGVNLAADWFLTDGFIIVEKPLRGIVDTPADSRHLSFDFRLDRNIGNRGKAFIRAAVFGEARNNGTILQTNRTHLRSFSGGFDLKPTSFGSFSVRLWGGSQVFDQNFSAVAANRNMETLTRVQRVPAQVFGFSAQWTRDFGKRQTLVTGIEAREVRGVSDETIFISNAASSVVSAGGRERAFGIFAVDSIGFSPNFTVTAKLRFDRWLEFAGKSETRSVAQPSQMTVNNFPNRTENAFSPQISLLYRLRNSFAVFASAYSAFRAPTLNELYRGFRVGNVLTLPNENLRAERLTGAETGINLNFKKPKIEFRAVAFWSEISRPVANVTLAVAPALITRQRQNLGKTRSRGLEFEFDFRAFQNWIMTGGYLFAEAKITDFPANPALIGLLLPQVARHQFTFQARYTNPRILNFAWQSRFGGRQFDDDQNLLPLKSYLTIDAFASRRLNRRFEVFAAIENLFNNRIEVGRTPVTTTGSPAVLRGGFRLVFGNR